jgi:hypothetical protein
LPEFTRLTSTKRSSEVIRGHPRSSEVLRGPQRSSEDIRGHQRSSEVLSSPGRRAVRCLRTPRWQSECNQHAISSPGRRAVRSEAISMQSACNQLTRPTSGKMPPDAEIAFSRSPSKISHTPLTPSLVSSVLFESLPVPRKEFAKVSAVSAVPVKGGARRRCEHMHARLGSSRCPPSRQYLTTRTSRRAVCRP